MAKKKQNFEIFAKDDKILSIAITDSSGNAVDLTGAKVRWRLSVSPYDTPLIQKSSTAGTSQVNITNSTGGLVDVIIAGSDTTNLNGVYYHEAEVEDATSNKTTVTIGYATITRALI